MRERIADVFKSVGQPTSTYVKRDSGRLEELLNGFLNEEGQICLITGPSKTGKTTLYKEVLSKRGETPLVVQCDRSTKCDDIWRRSLEGVDFSRVTVRERALEKVSEVTGEISGEIGWPWLAGLIGKLGVRREEKVDESSARELVLADPGPDHLIPVLKGTSYVLVIEDFHYLQDSEKVVLFQQWKRFVDNEVSVLILGTTHRAVDIANSNKDLIGRIGQIDIGNWETEDLSKIIEQGFSHLSIKIPHYAKKLIHSKITSEAVGLPIIVQQVCLQLVTAEGYEFSDDVRIKKIDIDSAKVDKALHSVARQKYNQFDNYYNTLIRGPRENARKYKTYELVLACFTLDPIKFSLTRSELDHRINALVLKSGEMPPAASINSTLSALGRFQIGRGMSLLEWVPNDATLYIIEPAFLFFVRWRHQKNSKQMQLDLFEELIIITREMHKHTFESIEIKMSNLERAAKD